MRVYHFLNKEFGLKNLRERRLKIARIMELNDPFEFLGADLSDHDKRNALRQTKAQMSVGHGLLCFSRSWHNPVLWGHYADKHRGMCLGFDIPTDLLRQICYVKSRLTWPKIVDENFVQKLLFTKFLHWSYEDEYRVFLSLDTHIDGLYYADFSEKLVLRQVIVGAEADIARTEVMSALGNLSTNTEVFKARAAFKSFRTVRNKNEALWA